MLLLVLFLSALQLRDSSSLNSPNISTKSAIESSTFSLSSLSISSTEEATTLPASSQPSASSFSQLKICQKEDLPNSQAIFSCSRIIWKEFTLNVSNLDPKKFSDWMEVVEQIEADVLIEKTSLKEIGFKKLNASIGAFIVKNNEKLKKIHLEQNLENGTLLISENPQLMNLSLLNQQGVIRTSNWTIFGNPRLERIDIHSKDELIFEEQLLIERNSAIQRLNLSGGGLSARMFGFNNNNLKKNLSLDLTNLKKFQIETIQIIGNKGLLSVKFDLNRTVFDLNGTVEVSKNDQLKELQLPLSKSSLKELKVERNSKLESIKWLENFVPGRQMFIRGNTKLGEKDLEKMRQLANYRSVIQDFGECIFDSCLTKLEALTPCRCVEGDLCFAANMTGNSTSIYLHKISGNLNLGNLADERLIFLNNTTVIGAVSSDFCDFNFGVIFSKPVDTVPCGSTVFPQTSTAKSRKSQSQSEKEKAIAERGIVTASVIGCLALLIFLFFIGLTIFSCRQNSMGYLRTEGRSIRESSALSLASRESISFLENSREEVLAEDKTQATSKTISKKTPKKGNNEPPPKRSNEPQSKGSNEPSKKTTEPEIPPN